MKLTIAATIVILASQITLVRADALPIGDGAYLPNQQQCAALLAGELEMVEFEVSNSGNAYAYPEVSCVVASVDKVRDGRFNVEGDCREFGEIWQNSFFLDVEDGGSIKLDGRPLALCSAATGATLTSTREWAEFQSMAPDTLCAFRVKSYAPQYWYDDESKTNDLEEIEGLPMGSEVFLLNSQNTTVEVLDGKQLVFGFKGYFIQADSLDFVGDCGPSR